MSHQQFCGILHSIELWPTAQDSSGQSVQFLECLPLQMSPNALKCLEMPPCSNYLEAAGQSLGCHGKPRLAWHPTIIRSACFSILSLSVFSCQQITSRFRGGKDNFFLCHTNQGLTDHPQYLNRTLLPQYSIQPKLSQLDFCKIKGLLYDTPTIHHTIDVFISTEGALKLPTTYDNHPSNPITSPPSIHI